MWEIKITLGRTNTPPEEGSPSRPRSVPESWVAEARRVYHLTIGDGETRGAKEAFAALLKSAALITGRSVEDLRTEATGLAPDPVELIGPAFEPVEVPNADDPLPPEVDPEEVIGEYDQGILIVDHQREALAPGHQRPAGTFTQEDLERESPFDGVAAQAAQNEEQMVHDLANGLRVIVSGVPLPKDVADQLAAGTHELVNGVPIPIDEVALDIGRLRDLGVSPIMVGVGDDSVILPDFDEDPDEEPALTVDETGTLVTLDDVPALDVPDRSLEATAMGVTITSASSYTPRTRRRDPDAPVLTL